MLSVKLEDLRYMNTKTCKFFWVVMLLFVLVIKDNVKAQSPDSVTIMGFKEGDELFYNRFDVDGSFIDDRKATIKFDSIDVFGNKHFTFRSFLFLTPMLMYEDTLGYIFARGWTTSNIEGYSNIYRPNIGIDSTWILNSSVDSKSAAQVLDILPRVNFGVADTITAIQYGSILSFDPYDVLPFEYTEWSPSFGIVFSANEEGGERFELKGAIIDGNKYGFTELITGNEVDHTIPEKVVLNQNYPNPFNPSTTISFELHNASNVTLLIYDIKGVLVSKVIDGIQYSIGSHSVIFNINNAVKGLPSGLYIYELKTEESVITKKMTLIK